MKNRAAEIQRWFETIQGKRLDMDGFPLGKEAQCVDVPKHLIRYVLGGMPGSYGNGVDVAGNLARTSMFDAVPKGQLIQTGDVVSFGAPLGQIRRKDGTVARYGHVGVAYSDQQGNTVRVVDQDGYSSGQGVHVSEFPVSYVVGIARPKKYTQAESATAAPTVYVVATHGLNRRTTPGDLRISGLAYPGAPLYRGARWHATGKTAKDKYGGTWIEGRSDWEKAANRPATWVHGSYLKAVK